MRVDGVMRVIAEVPKGDARAFNLWYELDKVPEVYAAPSVIGAHRDRAGDEILSCRVQARGQIVDRRGARLRGPSIRCEGGMNTPRVSTTAKLAAASAGRVPATAHPHSIPLGRFPASNPDSSGTAEIA